MILYPKAYLESVKDIPENSFHEDKIQRLKRYDRVILNELNMGRILNLLLCIDKYDDFNTEIAVLKSINDYLIWIYLKNKDNPDSKEVPQKFKWR